MPRSVGRTILNIGVSLTIRRQWHARVKIVFEYVFKSVLDVTLLDPTNCGKGCRNGFARVTILFFNKKINKGLGIKLYLRNAKKNTRYFTKMTTRDSIKFF